MKDLKLFRKEALAELSVGERLDTAVQVVSSRGWLALACIGILVAMVLVWAVAAEISYTVTGYGMLMRPGQVDAVLSVGSGRLAHVVVREGEVISAGQVIARIEQPELRRQLISEEDRLAELQESYEQLSRLDREMYGLKVSFLSRRSSILRDIIREKEKQLKSINRQLASQQALFERGLIALPKLVESTNTVLQVKEDLENKRNELNRISSERVAVQKGLEEQRIMLQRQIAESERRVVELQNRMEVQSIVRATEAGRVTEVRLESGDYVAAGRALVTLESLETGPENLGVVFYLAMVEGKRVKPGMVIRIVPSTLKMEEDGYLLGEVASISTFPVSQQAILRVVRNDKLAEELTKSGPVYEGRGTLRLDPQGSSGLSWSNGSGPDVPIHSGTSCSVQIAVRSLRPFELFLPAVRKMLGQSVRKTPGHT